MRASALLLLLLTSPALAEDKPSCKDLSPEPGIPFDAGGRVVIDRANWRLLFCAEDGLATAVVDLPQEEMGQSTVDARNGYASIVYRPAEGKAPVLALFDAAGRKLAEKKVKAMNAVIWVEDDRVKAGAAGEPVSVLIRVKPVAPKAAPKDGATAGGRAPL